MKPENGSDVENHINCYEQDRAKCNTCNIILEDSRDVHSQRNRSHRSNLRTPAEGVCGFCEPEKRIPCNHCSQKFECDLDRICHESLQYDF